MLSLSGAFRLLARKNKFKLNPLKNTFFNRKANIDFTFTYTHTHTVGYDSDCFVTNYNHSFKQACKMSLVRVSVMLGFWLWLMKPYWLGYRL